MLSCSQQVAEHNATRTCSSSSSYTLLVFFLSSLSFITSLHSLFTFFLSNWCIKFATDDQLLQSTNKSTCMHRHSALQKTISLTYRHWRGASAACIRSLLLKEGCPNSSWQGLGEAREQLSTHTYAHACIPWNMKPYYTFYTQTSATRWRWNTQPHISQKKRFNVFCLCQRFHCSFVHLARSVLRQHATGLCTLVTAQHGQMSIDMRRTKADIITKRCNLSNMLSESIYSHTVYA